MKPRINFFQNTGLIVVAALIICSSCKKDNNTKPPMASPEPEMEYTNLNNKEVKFSAPGIFIDINKDGRTDILFGHMTVGDPIAKQDKWQFIVVSDRLTNLAVNAAEEVPVMNHRSVIPLNDFNGYYWYGLSSVVLVQKVVSNDKPQYWEGKWKNAAQKYLPVQVIKNEKQYNGWVELTVDIANEKIILHRAAITKEAANEIKAGL